LCSNPRREPLAIGYTVAHQADLARGAATRERILAIGAWGKVGFGNCKSIPGAVRFKAVAWTATVGLTRSRLDQWQSHMSAFRPFRISYEASTGRTRRE
jgi:hypothetical protein